MARAVACRRLPEARRTTENILSVSVGQSWLLLISYQLLCAEVRGSFLLSTSVQNINAHQTSPTLICIHLSSHSCFCGTVNFGVRMHQVSLIFFPHCISIIYPISAHYSCFQYPILTHEQTYYNY